MELNHHPSVSTLADFTFGTTTNIADLVIQAHLSACSECRKIVEDLESVGGELLMHGGHVRPRIDRSLQNEGLRICEEYENGEKNKDDDPLKSSRIGGLDKGSELSDLFSTYLNCSFEALPWKTAQNRPKLTERRSSNL